MRVLCKGPFSFCVFFSVGSIRHRSRSGEVIELLICSLCRGMFELFKHLPAILISQPLIG